MSSPSSVDEEPKRRYRFGFVLNTTIGNMTRYVNLRKYAERDRDVECVWAPVSHYQADNASGLLRFLPRPVRMRIDLLRQSRPVMRQLPRLDAVMVHLFEVDLLLSLRNYFSAKPLHVSSTDEGPVTDRSTYPLYPQELAKPVWRQKLRLAIDLWRVRHTDLFIPFSHWVAGILTRDCGVPTDRVHALHVGLDLELWDGPPRPQRAPGARMKILFVGGDFVRKGGALLLQIFDERFGDNAELHLVTRQAPKTLPANVHVHAGFEPNDKGLTELYRQVDLLVVPTTADTGPLWVFMEAMAMRLPIIGTDTGANAELVRHGETGLIVPIGDGPALGDAIQSLLDDPALRHRMGENGRAFIEARYNAEINVPLILQAMKAAADASKAERRA